MEGKSICGEEKLIGVIDELLNYMKTCNNIELGSSTHERIKNILNSAAAKINDLSGLCRGTEKELDVLKEKVNEARSVAEEHMLKNVNLEKENTDLKNKLENANVVIENNKQLVMEQQARIVKLKEIVSDVVNKI